MVVPTTAVSFFVGSRVEALGNCWKRLKKMSNQKTQMHSDGFGELVFDQISPVKYYQT